MSQRRPLILGLNSVYHESSAALFCGAELLAYGEEERFTRVKKAKRAAIDNAHHLPVRAIVHCLETAGATWADIDWVAYSYDPAQRVLTPGDDVIPGDWGSTRGEVAFQTSLARVPEILHELGGNPDRLRWAPHHAAHAASAYLASPYDQAAVLSIDGIGETTTTWCGLGSGPDLKALWELRYPHSLGFLWERLSMYLGLDQYEGPGQLMGLAAWGDPERYAAELAKVLTAEADGFRIDNHWTRFRAISDRLADLFGPRYQERSELDSRAADVAAALQAATERVLLGLAEGLRERTTATALCLAGGVALNAVAVGRIVRESGYADVFVQPAAGDAGTSLGAALWLAHTELGMTDRWVMGHPYLGPSFSDADYRAAIEQAGLHAIQPDDIVGHTAQMLADGAMVGWFQGAAEAGPRALGNRSLLADARDPLMADRINLHAKRRQYWRPYSLSIMASHTAGWIDMGGARSSSHATMNLTHPVSPGKRRHLAAVVHADGCTRAQVVTPDTNPRYHELLARFHRLTGVPGVLNTSLNGPGQPIVNTPADAIDLFQRTGMDALALGDHLVRREGNHR